MITMNALKSQQAIGANASTRKVVRMPEDDRTGLYDPTEEYAWDFDNGYPLDPDDDDGEDEE